MRKRSRMGADPDQVSAAVIAKATAGETAKSKARKRRKNPAAVALGRMGGKKGGKARAASLSKARRTSIARHAALVRWSASVRGE